MGSLVDTLAGRLAADANVGIHLGIGVADLGHAAGNLSVRLSDGSSIRADGVVLAGPASASATSLAALAPAVVSPLLGIPHGSTAVVTLVYRAAQLADPPSHGFLVARDEALTFSACTWLVREMGGSSPRRLGAGTRVPRRAFLGAARPGG